MRRRNGDVVVGIDFSREAVEAHLKNDRRAALGDASDSDFWERVELAANGIDLVMLTLPDVNASAFAIQQMKSRGYAGQITASVRYEDEINRLKQVGIDAAYVVYQEAGVGFADHACKHMEHCRLQETGLTS
jgi:Trk K+ transport system NAD-binding subunit